MDVTNMDNEEESKAPRPSFPESVRDSLDVGGVKPRGEGGGEGREATPKAPITTTIHRVQSEKFFEVTPINFEYHKRREEFGRQPQFLEDHSRIHVGLNEIEKLEDNYEEMMVVEETEDTYVDQRNNSTNTGRAEYKSFSLLHTEGAWPKEINIRDAEIVDKTKKKMQRDESFLDAVPSMAKEADYLVRYNNTLPLYSRYYRKCNSVRRRDTKPRANVVAVYRCPSAKKRPVSRITFAPESAGRMAVAYCPYEYDPMLREHSNEAFFWEVENPTRPEGLVRAPAQIVDVRYHPKDVHSICGALFTGQVATWDNRVGPNPQYMTPYEASHEDVCTSALWINSKTGTEFFSCGLDGKIIWWDERNLSERLDFTFADPVKGRSEAVHALPVTTLDYEHTLPTKFLVGTQFGQVMVFMKKGKTPMDRLINMYKAHKGPVRSIHRNPVFIKNFLSCGDYHIRVFAEDCRDSGIMWTAPSDALYTYANWLTGRPCGLVASRVDGCLEFWDLLIQGTTSMLTTKVSHHPLSTVCPSDAGTHVAAGTVSGDIRMVKLCESLHTFGKPDKTALAACFERESRREKYLEQRGREIRLAKKQKEGKAKNTGGDGAKFSFSEHGQEAKKSGKYKKPEPFKNPQLRVDKKFFVTIADEKKKQGINAFPDKKMAAKAFSQVMYKGRMAEKKKQMIKSNKTEDWTLGVEQVMSVNDETLKQANQDMDDVEKKRADAIAKGEDPENVQLKEIVEPDFPSGRLEEELPVVPMMEPNTELDTEDLEPEAEPEPEPAGCWLNLKSEPAAAEPEPEEDEENDAPGEEEDGEEADYLD
ncbi:Dynein intermediate chain 3, ciliary [Orchesella cincta]|uniref:Dynein intermediate chain 3, ciliary n=1 Tax=Orchesella cincta TaxID=48709 RepID=A0A1D2NH87_ORCCI|nr:Dynein intermediate chain 3, ciliary [Orchesella cincta]